MKQHIYRQTHRNRPIMNLNFFSVCIVSEPRTLEKRNLPATTDFDHSKVKCRLIREFSARRKADIQIADRMRKFI